MYICVYVLCTCVFLIIMGLCNFLGWQVVEVPMCHGRILVGWTILRESFKRYALKTMTAYTACHFLFLRWISSSGGCLCSQLSTFMIMVVFCVVKTFVFNC